MSVFISCEGDLVWGRGLWDVLRDFRCKKWVVIFIENLYVFSIWFIGLCILVIIDVLFGILFKMFMLLCVDKSL